MIRAIIFIDELIFTKAKLVKIKAKSVEIKAKLVKIKAKSVKIGQNRPKSAGVSAANGG